MNINLLDLAKKAEALHQEVVCSFGTIKVYHVPDVMLMSARFSYPEPEQPLVKMKTATGHQNRLSKPGDKEHSKWLSEMADYNEEVFRLRNAIRMVSALKDIEFPDISKPPTSEANKIYNGNWPESEMLRKKIWLDFTILSKRSDSDAIIIAVNEMNGEMEATDNMVDEVKKSSE